ncbi:MAG: site-2 protease family protein [Candidatus Paceibacterota bacterium]
MIGVPTAVEEATVSTDAELVVTEVLADSPAAEAGFPIGAVITAVARDDEEVTTLNPAAVTEFIQAPESEPILITYQDGEESKTLTLTPETNIVSDQTAPAIGVRLSLIETIALPLHQALYQATVELLVLRCYHSRSYYFDC